jgi:hypothetical protein
MSQLFFKIEEKGREARLLIPELFAVYLEAFAEGEEVDPNTEVKVSHYLKDGETPYEIPVGTIRYSKEHEKFAYILG